MTECKCKRTSAVDLSAGFQESFVPVYDDTPKFRVYGYTRQQLNDTASEGEIAGWTRTGEAHTLEMVAHLVNSGAELIVIQKNPKETP